MKKVGKPRSVRRWYPVARQQTIIVGNAVVEKSAWDYLWITWSGDSKVAYIEEVYKTDGLSVESQTKSEARAKLKSVLRIPKKGRLPAGASVRCSYP